MEKKSIRLMLCFLMMVSIFVGIGSVKPALGGRYGDA